MRVIELSSVGPNPAPSATDLRHTHLALIDREPIVRGGCLHRPTWVRDNYSARDQSCRRSLTAALRFGVRSSELRVAQR